MHMKRNRQDPVTEILTRSVSAIIPSREALKELLLSGNKIRVYVGIDPTADYVHIGHSTNYFILERLHKLGHKIIVLVGDFTAMIGDPSDKSSVRPALTREGVLKNLQTFKEQIGKILNFEDKENPIEFVFNSNWLSKLDFKKLVELASNFTVQQMLERDMFEKRIQENKPLYVHEFFYPLLQGYDSVALEVDLEIGGTDQTFNMLAGRTLSRRYLNREKLVLTTTLLANPATGAKLMSKSLGTGIGLNELPDSMFGKVMALPDESMIQIFTDCTRLSLHEIDAKQTRLDEGENPKNIKLELAHEIVTMYHTADAATKAQNNWIKVFSKKKIPDSLQEISAKMNEELLSFLSRVNLISSKSDGRRLIKQGAVEYNDAVVQDTAFRIQKPGTLRVGKKKIIRIVLESV